MPLPVKKEINFHISFSSNNKMSFAKYKEKVENGDTIILYLGFKTMHSLVVKAGDVFQTKFGAVRHSDLIGVKFGNRFQCKNGYFHVLYPTPELWTMTLPHRTQILYSTDISMVTLQLDLRPGSIVVESGTGSGSLSHAIIRTIAPTGHLYTFEFHDQRAKIAKDEFNSHGVGDSVTVTHRDVCQNGFQLDHVADAVFLDLPKPWEAITSAKKALKLQGGRLCSFSPCIEQVQRTCEKLTSEGFQDLSTLECLLRTFDVRTINMPIADLGSDTADGGIDQPPEKMACVEKSVVDDTVGDKVEITICTSSGRDFTDADQNNDANMSPQKSNPGRVKKKNYDLDLIGKQDGKNFIFKASVPPLQMPGHTGFLTFATLYPS